MGDINKQMYIIKRSGEQKDFDINKIIIAIQKANGEVDPSLRLTQDKIIKIANEVEQQCIALSRAANVEEIQDMVERKIVGCGNYEVAKEYIIYRYKRSLARQANTIDDKILSLLSFSNEEIKQENSNKNPLINSVQRDYMAGEVSKDIARRIMLPKDIMEAHDKGIIHMHDLDYISQRMHNCDLVNLEDMLQNGTVISEVMIEKPHSFSTACNIATQIIAQVASSQYGGQSVTLSHLAPFVEVSRQKFRKEVEDELKDLADYSIELRDEVAEKRLKKEIEKGCQVIQYQITTLMTTNGQAPFVTVFMYLDEVEDQHTKDDLALIIEEMLHQRILGVKNEKGAYITPAFPKLIYVLDENNIYPDSKYYYLTKLAAKCTAKRMVPDYISAKKMKELKNGDVYPAMGCRSFLTPDIEGFNPDGSHKYYGRFNCGVCTINLVDIACSSKKDETKFWELFDERMEKYVHRALQERHKRLSGTPASVAPILWQHGAIARLEPNETIDKLLYNNYCTISIGFAGLAEAVYYMKGVSHTTEEGKEFGLRVMQFLNDKAAKWRAEENISYSVYGTPLEATTYKFAQCLQKRFGIIENVTDHNYITNSYHICVREEIDAFSKLSKEAEFQELAPGGAISYIESPDMQHNIEAVLSIMKHMYDTILYAEINAKSDYCMECGYDGEIQIIEDDHGKLIWECPNCGNRDQEKMNVARRSCGYIGTQFWNQGRTQEIQDRVLHL